MIELFGKAEEEILTAEQTVNKCSVYKKSVSFSNAKSQGIESPLAFWRLMRPPFSHTAHYCFFSNAARSL